MAESSIKKKASKSAGNSPVNVVWDETTVKDKHYKVLGILKGLTVTQAKLVLDIVIEDFVSNAIIS
ncbi:hypothetical protein [Ferruginibacter sp.]|nr:hypothetical protein [Ferruginibacter sp.]